MVHLQKMTNKKYILKILNGILILTIGLFVLDGLTHFDIKSQIIKSFTYFGMLILTPLALIWNLRNFKKTKWQIIRLTLSILALIGILIIGPMKIIFSSGSWKTQTIIYQNGHLNFKKVEFQMQDVGALGYKKRTVEITYLTKLFLST